MCWCPADKAANNVIVVCMKYYLDVILAELNKDNVNTYVACNEPSVDVVARHLLDLKQWNIAVSGELQQLPTLYWLPKLHKNPYGSRFIAASCKCTTKPLSKLLTTCLSAVIKHFKEYCEGIVRNTGVNCFWIISNSLEVMDMLQRINVTRKAKCFDSYDFSTLYTSIPHDSLKYSLKVLISEAYRVRGALYLAVNKKGMCAWSNSRGSYVDVSESVLMDMVEYLVDNIYICVGDRVFRQCIDIPMGTDCAPLLANLYLFYYEYSYMKQLLKVNMGKARMFSNTVRYIDDLLALNNPSFDEEIANIYPKELILKKTTEGHSMVSYLDLKITIEEREYVTAIWDKRDSFNFRIVNYPFLSSNIPAGPAYGTYISQLVRIGRICVKYEDFRSRHMILTTRPH